MELDEEAFQSLYGRWQPLTPDQVGALMGDLGWWVVGGWSLELSTGVRRAHDDLDVAVARDDLHEVAAQLSGFHLWAAQQGSLTPLQHFDQLPDDHEQLWVRRDASSPWLLDLQLQPVDGPDWVFKRDPRIRVPMSRAVRTTGGVRHLAPELALLHKAHLCRPKDEADLVATLPTLSRPAVAWLAWAMALAVPDSPWRGELETG